MMNMKPTMIYAIGDIHGHKSLLAELLKLIREDAAAQAIDQPKVILLGDYIDRGPDSRGVLDFLLSRRFLAAYDPVCLRGNHEQMLLDVLEGDRGGMWLHGGGLQTVAAYGVKIAGRAPSEYLPEFRSRFPESHHRFLRSLPFLHREHGYVFVHGGVDPRRPIERQKPADLLWGGLRFLDYDGDYGARIVHGHSPTSEPVILHNRIGIDTRCGFPGGKLTAAALGGNTVRVFQVGPADENWHQSASAGWRPRCRGQPSNYRIGESSQ